MQASSIRHPSKDIVGSRGSELAGVKIALCVTGSAAIYRAPELARELMRLGAEVIPVLTEVAASLLSPSMMEWATGNKAVVELTGEVEHIALTQEGGVDLVLIAPATANTLSKVAYGISDNAATTLVASALGSKIPVLAVPVMHASLYQNPAFQEALKRLSAFGVAIIEPRWEEGKAKMPSVNEIVSAVVSMARKAGEFRGVKFLITAGPTREPLDAVRFLTNPSSGKMGFELAREAWRRGGRVTLVKGPVALSQPLPSEVEVVEVVTTKDMYDAVERKLKEGGYHVVILAAAPLDYGFSATYSYKIPSGSQYIEARLEARPKISMAVRKLAPEVVFVGFKAEYGVAVEELIERAYSRLAESGMDLIVANDLAKQGCGFSADTNEVFIVDRGRRVVHVPLSPKRKVAEAILDVVAQELARRGVIKS
ncbi:MAG: bifunctional phosphopantothenoylcysteine decarboxylase/phosphopantothenate--cysteine ligase CoaBC [Candidatus Nezhaarchaeota archaeon]|nr:bifunctional phosphopantothenoylcysteine decarboxylase/phosphopantothenate--cysteine ligase CoaBC [Candidatus Nezhaarchaeota archaeon]